MLEPTGAGAAAGGRLALRLGQTEATSPAETLGPIFRAGP